MRLLAGKFSCLIGIIFAIVGVLTTMMGYGASIAADVVGILFGVLGYSLGSRGLGALTIILCVIALFFGVAAGQGLIPGFEGYGR